MYKNDIKEKERIKESKVTKTMDPDPIVIVVLIHQVEVQFELRHICRFLQLRNITKS